MIPQGKLPRDILWTLGSFAFLATSGVVINFAVVGLRDATSLGVFNLSYAVYMLVSQIAIWGVHYSVLRNAAYYSCSAKRRGLLIATAILFGLVFGLVATLTLVLLAPYLGILFKSTSTGEAIKLAAFGLLLFPVNKVLIAYVNALRHMRAFALLQALRYLCVMLWVGAICASEFSFAWTSFGFFVAEVVTLLAALFYLQRVSLLRYLRWSPSWGRRHFSFGAKSLPSGMFVEANSRLDVLLIGFFFGQFAVGVYSFAAMLVDGLLQILAMIRVNLNPILVEIFRDSLWSQGRDLFRVTRRYIYLASFFLSLGILFVFWIFTNQIMPDKDLQGGMGSLIILLAGLGLVSAYIPFDNVLMVSGFPFYQTFQNLSVVGVNLLAGIILVPRFGIEGAALATAGSYLAGIAVMIFFVKRLTGWNLIYNKARF